MNKVLDWLMEKWLGQFLSNAPILKWVDGWKTEINTGLMLVSATLAILKTQYPQLPVDEWSLVFSTIATYIGRVLSIAHNRYKENKVPQE